MTTQDRVNTARLLLAETADLSPTELHTLASLVGAMLLDLNADDLRAVQDRRRYGSVLERLNAHCVERAGT